MDKLSQISNITDYSLTTLRLCNKRTNSVSITTYHDINMKSNKTADTTT